MLGGARIEAHPTKTKCKVGICQVKLNSNKTRVGFETRTSHRSLVVGKAANDTTETEDEEKEKEKEKKREKEKEKEKTETRPSVRKRWSKLKEIIHPTQTALGWDWVLFKMKNLTTEEDAQKYLNRKPVPAVKRGEIYYIVDHHHTLCALEASGWDVKVTIVVIMEVPEDLSTIDQFWVFMEHRGWSFVRNSDYTKGSFSQLPSGFDINGYHNDIYRSMGGFARVYNVLVRPKNLEARLFFEFKWGYFFYTHSEDAYGLWHDKRLFRSYERVRRLLEEVDMQEYVSENMTSLSPAECTYLSDNVIEPAYRLVMFYLRALCMQYNKLSNEEKQDVVPDLALMFGENNKVLPEDCIVETKEFNYGDLQSFGKLDDNLATFDDGFEEYGDESMYDKWSITPSLFGTLDEKVGNLGF